ncbi:unnamed protein product [Vitrella brassicaformis CCMP3155]|uniref:Uncharacterized protein n=2 Tax=Vitrella brassicaformis TaxID=1169539 RepID=A0A0G4E940_VITBC|nr:unnamed protein product [Vitrella brassicaformis CCMP3155]|eukprot:CEL91725.1 unnamed protein product [Vitrella brassicaformis CCMP3155]
MYHITVAPKVPVAVLKVASEAAVECPLLMDGSQSFLPQQGNSTPTVNGTTAEQDGDATRVQLSPETYDFRWRCYVLAVLSSVNISNPVVLARIVDSLDDINLYPCLTNSNTTYESAEELLNAQNSLEAVVPDHILQFPQYDVPMRVLTLLFELTIVHRQSGIASGAAYAATRLYQGTPVNSTAILTASSDSTKGPIPPSPFRVCLTTLSSSLCQASITNVPHPTLTTYSASNGTLVPLLSDVETRESTLTVMNEVSGLVDERKYTMRVLVWHIDVLPTGEYGLRLKGLAGGSGQFETRVDGIRVNAGPTEGRLLVREHVAWSSGLQTDFDITMDQIHDPDLPLSYSFYATSSLLAGQLPPGQTPALLSAWAGSNHRFVPIPFDAFDFGVPVVPAGETAHVWVVGQAADVFGEKSEYVLSEQVNISVPVLNATEEGINELLTYLALLRETSMSFTDLKNRLWISLQSLRGQTPPITFEEHPALARAFLEAIKRLEDVFVPRGGSPPDRYIASGVQTASLIEGDDSVAQEALQISTMMAAAVVSGAFVCQDEIDLSLQLFDYWRRVYSGSGSVSYTKSAATHASLFAHSAGLYNSTRRKELHEIMVRGLLMGLGDDLRAKKEAATNAPATRRLQGGDRIQGMTIAGPTVTLLVSHVPENISQLWETPLSSEDVWYLADYLNKNLPSLRLFTTAEKLPPRRFPLPTLIDRGFPSTPLPRYFPFSIQSPSPITYWADGFHISVPLGSLFTNETTRVSPPPVYSSVQKAKVTDELTLRPEAVMDFGGVTTLWGMENPYGQLVDREGVDYHGAAKEGSVTNNSMFAIGEGEALTPIVEMDLAIFLDDYTPTTLQAPITYMAIFVDLPFRAHILPTLIAMPSILNSTFMAPSSTSLNLPRCRRWLPSKGQWAALGCRVLSVSAAGYTYGCQHEISRGGAGGFWEVMGVGEAIHRYETYFVESLVVETILNPMNNGFFMLLAIIATIVMGLLLVITKDGAFQVRNTELVDKYFFRAESEPRSCCVHIWRKARAVYPILKLFNLCSCVRRSSLQYLQLSAKEGAGEEESWSLKSFAGILHRFSPVSIHDIVEGHYERTGETLTAQQVLKLCLAVEKTEQALREYRAKVMRSRDSKISRLALDLRILRKFAFSFGTSLFLLLNRTEAFTANLWSRVMLLAYLRRAERSATYIQACYLSYRAGLLGVTESLQMFQSVPATRGSPAPATRGLVAHSGHVGTDRSEDIEFPTHGRLPLLRHGVHGAPPPPSPPQSEPDEQAAPSVTETQKSSRKDLDRRETGVTIALGDAEEGPGELPGAADIKKPSGRRGSVIDQQRRLSSVSRGSTFRRASVMLKQLASMASKGSKQTEEVSERSAASRDEDEHLMESLVVDLSPQRRGSVAGSRRRSSVLAKQPTGESKGTSIVPEKQETAVFTDLTSHRPLPEADGGKETAVPPRARRGSMVGLSSPTQPCLGTAESSEAESGHEGEEGGEEAREESKEEDRETEEVVTVITDTEARKFFDDGVDIGTHAPPMPSFGPAEKEDRIASRRRADFLLGDTLKAMGAAAPQKSKQEALVKFQRRLFLREQAQLQRLLPSVDSAVFSASDSVWEANRMTNRDEPWLSKMAAVHAHHIVRGETDETARLGLTEETIKAIRRFVEEEKTLPAALKAASGRTGGGADDEGEVGEIEAGEKEAGSLDMDGWVAATMQDDGTEDFQRCLLSLRSIGLVIEVPVSGKNAVPPPRHEQRPKAKRASKPPSEDVKPYASGTRPLIAISGLADLFHTRQPSGVSHKSRRASADEQETQSMSDRDESEEGRERVLEGFEEFDEDNGPKPSPVRQQMAVAMQSQLLVVGYIRWSDIVEAEVIEESDIAVDLQAPILRLPAHIILDVHYKTERMRVMNQWNDPPLARNIRESAEQKRTRLLRVGEEEMEADAGVVETEAFGCQTVRFCISDLDAAQRFVADLHEERNLRCFLSRRGYLTHSLATSLKARPRVQMLKTLRQLVGAEQMAGRASAKQPSMRTGVTIETDNVTVAKKDAKQQFFVEMKKMELNRLICRFRVLGLHSFWLFCSVVCKHHPWGQCFIPSLQAPHVLHDLLLVFKFLLTLDIGLFVEVYKGTLGESLAFLTEDAGVLWGFRVTMSDLCFLLVASMIAEVLKLFVKWWAVKVPTYAPDADTDEKLKDSVHRAWMCRDRVIRILWICFLITSLAFLAFFLQFSANPSAADRWFRFVLSLLVLETVIPLVWMLVVWWLLIEARNSTRVDWVLKRLPHLLIYVHMYENNPSEIARDLRDVEEREAFW